MESVLVEGSLFPDLKLSFEGFDLMAMRRFGVFCWVSSHSAGMVVKVGPAEHDCFDILLMCVWHVRRKKNGVIA